MIKKDYDIQHALAHIEIGSPIVDATIVQKRFGASALHRFFSELRDGHRLALTEYDKRLGTVVGCHEENELRGYGPFGAFAGRLAIRESGLIAIESVLHHTSSPELKVSLQDSLRNAVTVLKNS